MAEPDLPVPVLVSFRLSERPSHWRRPGRRRLPASCERLPRTQSADSRAGTAAGRRRRCRRLKSSGRVGLLPAPGESAAEFNLRRRSHRSTSKDSRWRLRLPTSRDSESRSPTPSRLLTDSEAHLAEPASLPARLRIAADSDSESAYHLAASLPQAECQ